MNYTVGMRIVCKSIYRTLRAHSINSRKKASSAVRLTRHNLAVTNLAGGFGALEIVLLVLDILSDKTKSCPSLQSMCEG